MTGKVKTCVFGPFWALCSGGWIVTISPFFDKVIGEKYQVGIVFFWGAGRSSKVDIFPYSLG